MNTLPHHTHEDWIRNGYIWRAYHCPVKGCGLAVSEYHWPNDPAYHVDPRTMQAHAAVCGDPVRVGEMHRFEDSQRRAAVDGKTAAAGDR